MVKLASRDCMAYEAHEETLDRRYWGTHIALDFVYTYKYSAGLPGRRGARGKSGSKVIVSSYLCTVFSIHEGEVCLIRHRSYRFNNSILFGCTSEDLSSKVNKSRVYRSSSYCKDENFRGFSMTEHFAGEKFRSSCLGCKSYDPVMHLKDVMYSEVEGVDCVRNNGV